VSPVIQTIDRHKSSSQERGLGRLEDCVCWDGGEVIVSVGHSERKWHGGEQNYYIACMIRRDPHAH
jgi:hypothetical protein